MKEVLKRIKQLKAALDRKTLENEILNEAVEYRVKAESGLRLPLVTQGRPTREVFSFLGVSRSHLTALKNRKANWVDRRKTPPKPDDAQLLNNIITGAKDLPTYGYRSVLAILKFHGVDGSPRPVGHKRV